MRKLKDFQGIKSVYLLICLSAIPHYPSDHPCRGSSGAGTAACRPAAPGCSARAGCWSCAATSPPWPANKRKNRALIRCTSFWLTSVRGTSQKYNLFDPWRGRVQNWKRCLLLIGCLFCSFLHSLSYLQTLETDKGGVGDLGKDLIQFKRREDQIHNRKLHNLMKAWSTRGHIQRFTKRFVRGCDSCETFIASLP